MIGITRAFQPITLQIDTKKDLDHLLRCLYQTIDGDLYSRWLSGPPKGEHVLFIQELAKRLAA